MNIFQLVLKQMRQRGIGHLAHIALRRPRVALAISIFSCARQDRRFLVRPIMSYDVLVGIGQGSPLDLTLNTVYHIYKSPGNVPYWVYETIDNPSRPPRGSREFNFNGT